MFGTWRIDKTYSVCDITYKFKELTHLSDTSVLSAQEFGDGQHPDTYYKMVYPGQTAIIGQFLPTSGDIALASETFGSLICSH